jgi:hypothetical protein
VESPIYATGIGLILHRMKYLNRRKMHVGQKVNIKAESKIFLKELNFVLMNYKNKSQESTIFKNLKYNQFLFMGKEKEI